MIAPGNESPAAESQADKQPEKVKAADLILQINAAETAEAVDALLPEGENRKTVLDAVEARKAQLSKPE